MKKFLFLLTIIITASAGFGQKLDFIVLTGHGADLKFYYVAADKAVIAISKDGTIAEFGTEYPKEFMGYYPGRLQKYMGRIEYYTQNDNEAFRGKVRYIGLTQITYYGSYDEEALRGKIKSISTTQFDYYASYDDAAVKGLLKNIGGVAISWCPSYENEAIRGRVKAIGNTRFDWYTSYDDKAIRGKVKQIDQYPFTYYTSFENTYGQQGQLKTGFYSKYINGINYFLRN